jgi:hypothetical protein
VVDAKILVGSTWMFIKFSAFGKFLISLPMHVAAVPSHLSQSISSFDKNISLIIITGWRITQLRKFPDFSFNSSGLSHDDRSTAHSNLSSRQLLNFYIFYFCVRESETGTEKIQCTCIIFNTILMFSFILSSIDNDGDLPMTMRFTFIFV